MFESPEFNRHVIGASAVAAAILGVAIWGSSWGTNQQSRIASLENAAQMASSGIERQATRTAREFSAVTEGRSAANNQQGQQGTRAMPQPPSGSRAGALGTAASAWKNWSDQDWQIAITAVQEHRSAAITPSGGPSQSTQQRGDNPAAGGSSTSDQQQWQAPPEISGNGARR